MAIVQNPLIGRAKKQAGGMVFATNHGANIMRAKPFQVKINNTIPARRKKVRFKAGNDLSLKLKGIAPQIYPGSYPGVGPYGRLCSDIHDSYKYVGDTLTFDPGACMIGPGKIVAPISSITWDDTWEFYKIDWSEYLLTKNTCFPADNTNFDMAVLFTKSDATICMMVPMSVNVVLEQAYFPRPAVLSGENYYISGIFLINRTDNVQFKFPLSLSGTTYNH
jgi:hypothetical protein